MNTSVITKNANKIGFALKKHSPTILMVAGVVGTVASTVMACKATMKVNDILEESKENIEKIHQVSEDEEFKDQYSEEDAKKDLTIVYVQTGVKLAKLYAPAIGLGVLSVASILTSNNIMRKRNVALAAAYATVDKGFKEYRNRVIDRFGEEVDKELKYNIQKKKIETLEVDEKTGKEKKVKKEVAVIDGIDGYSQYARFFDDGSSYWEKNSEYNLMFLRGRQQYANDLLMARGHLFLNEVYDMLDIPRTKAGQVVGWVYDPENNTKGDNYVDFGIYNVYRQPNRDFVNGHESSILLDFNVDGSVLDLI